MNTKFETILCSRCGGSGKYSFCEEYRDTCFKCGGHGKVLSARGLKANKFYTELCTIKLNEVKVGDVVLMHSITAFARGFNYIAEVVGVIRSESKVIQSIGNVREEYYPLSIVTEHHKYGRKGYSAKDDTPIRIYRSDDSVRLQQALKYQDSLTKTGKPRKGA